jgi:phospholipase A1
VFWGHGDLWLAYTQSPIGKSIIIIFPPFREVNYEPELILNFPVKFNLFGFKARMVGVALNHESNGKAILFRSWNRITGFERKNWTVYLRPWFRMPAAIDDNPDISEYIEGET